MTSIPASRRHATRATFSGLCSFVSTFLLLAPGAADAEVRRNLRYGDHLRQRLDLYLPDGSEVVAPGAPPLVVYFHGGGWQQGDKSEVLWVVDTLVEAGFAVASVNYRLAPAARWPAQKDDAFAAIRWLVERADQFGYDAGRLAVMGTSAGAHIALVCGLTANAEETKGPPVSAVVNLFGPTDFRFLLALPDQLGIDGIGLRMVRQLFGPDLTEERVTDASPAVAADAGDPPVLTIHGTADTVVPYAMATHLHEALKQVGSDSMLMPVKNGGHGGFLTRPEFAHRIRGFLLKTLNHNNRTDGNTDRLK